jgi:hypothetical protein
MNGLYFKHFITKVFTVYLLPILFFWLIQIIAPGLSLCSTATYNEGRHFIILIDDSGGMNKKYHRHNIKNIVPRLLFKGNHMNTDDLMNMDVLDKNVKFPIFDPEKDIISVLCFSIYAQGTQISPLADNMFTESTKIMIWPDKANKSDISNYSSYEFKNVFANWIDLNLTFKGQLSPIETSRTAVLPFINKKLNKDLPDRLFSEIFIITVTDKLYNTKVSPANELSSFRDPSAYKIRNQKPEIIEADFEEAINLSGRVLKYFYYSPIAEVSRYFKTYAKRVRSPHEVTWFIINKVEPISVSPDSLLTYMENVELDRMAISSDTIRVLLAKTDFAGLSIQKNDRLIPLSISYGFEEAGTGGGRLWTIGDNAMPGKFEKDIDLSDNGAFSAYRNYDETNNSLSIPLFKPQEMKSQDDWSAVNTGYLYAKVKFKFNTNGIYDHIFMESSKDPITLTPIKPVSVPKGGFGGVFGDNSLMDYINSLLGFKEIERLSNKELAALWQDSDGSSGLTQEKAKERILINRNRISSNVLISLAALLILVAILLVRFLYRRPFRPKLLWKPSAPIVIDLNSPTNSRLLIGTIEINNENNPIYGKLWAKKDHPTRKAEFSFSNDDLREFGLVLNTDESHLGFIVQDIKQPESARLDSMLQDTVTHGKQIYLFMAAESIEDLESHETMSDEGKSILVGFSVSMKYKKQNWWDSKASDLSEQFQLEIKPERARKPIVEFKKTEEKLHYSHDKKLPIGKMIFKSNASHLFAIPFTGKYELQSYNEDFPLQGQPIYLEQSELRIEPKKHRNIDMLLNCDGDIIKNPEPEKQSYQFKLIGEMDIEKSQMGKHEIELYRDPAKAEIELKLNYRNLTSEIYWTEEGGIKQIIHQNGGTKTVDVDSEKIIFEEPSELRFNLNRQSLDDLMVITVGNSAKSGNGYVEVKISSSLMFIGDKAVEAQNSLKLKKGFQHNDLPMILDIRSEKENSTVTVYEKIRSMESNPNPAERHIKIKTDLIERIDRGRISEKNCLVYLDFDIIVQPDKGEPCKRALTIEFPLYIEQEPGENWLCIDFGTSAITAAIGTGRKNELSIIPLQSIGQSTYKRSIETLDPGNSEKGTNFLPSFLICNADQRIEEGKDYIARPEGFPGYRPATLQIGEPSFIGLPALTHHISQKAGRIIYSLKSWIGKSSSVIELGEMIQYIDSNGQERTGNELPTENLVESTLSALIYGYLIAEPNINDYRTDQVILTYPNTFTPVHIELFRKAACNAFTKHFGIQNRDRIEMIRESDAVAYHYYNIRRTEHPPAETENILVYDFGAGTLDISVIQLEWEDRTPRRIKDNGWKIKGRIGIPIAGNYIDEIIARIVDELLQDDSLWKGCISYKRPLVAKNYIANDKFYHESISRFWKGLKDMKHIWDGENQFKIPIYWGSEIGIVGINNEKLKNEKPSMLDDYNICIPAHYIMNHPEMNAFINFVTVEILDELFGSMEGISKGQIDTLVISGRGSLWCGIVDKVTKEQFPNARFFDGLKSPDIMKEAVVRGGIARQDILFEFKDEAKNTIKLGLLRENDNIIILEDKWNEPVDLSDCPYFHFVQVMTKNPNWDSDQNSLRKYLYTDISVSLNADRYAYDRRLQINIETIKDKENKRDKGLRIITWKGNKSGGSNRIKFSATGVPLKPAWPIGKLLLDPDVNWKKYKGE